MLVCLLSFLLHLIRFRASHMKHSFRKDLQDYQDFFGLVWLILSILLILSENRKLRQLSFFFDVTGPFFWPAVGLKSFGSRNKMRS